MHSVAEVKFSYYVGCRERLLSRDYEGLVKFLHENEYTAIEPLESEISHERLFSSPGEAKRLSSFLNREGISVSCYSAFADIYSTPEASRDFLFEQAEIAAALGSPYLHHTIYPPFIPVPDMPDYEKALSVVFAPLCDVIKYAARLGVAVLYEPQGFVFNGKGLIKLLDELHRVDACSGVAVCFDFGNSAFVDYQPSALLTELLPLVRHVHLKDYKYLDASLSDCATYYTSSGRPMVETLLGDGDVQVESMLARLRDHGYDGYYSTELVPTYPKSYFDSAGVSAVKFARNILLDKHKSNGCKT